MRVVEFARPCASSDLTGVRDVETPEPRSGQVLIGVECAGANYVEGLDKVAGIHDALSNGSSSGKYVVRVS